MNFKAGDTVRVIDGSEAHNDIGEVQWIQKDGLIIVELDGGAIWPCTEDELSHVETNEKG